MASNTFPTQNFAQYEKFTIGGIPGFYTLQSQVNPANQLQFQNDTLPERFIPGGVVEWNNIIIDLGYCDWITSFGAPNNNLPTVSQINTYILSKYIPGPGMSGGIISVLPSAGPGSSLVNTTDSTPTVVYIKNLLPGTNISFVETTKTVTIDAALDIYGSFPETIDPDTLVISELTNPDTNASFAVGPAGTLSVSTSVNYQATIDGSKTETIGNGETHTVTGNFTVNSTGTSNISSDNGLLLGAGASDMQLNALGKIQCSIGPGQEFQIQNMDTANSTFINLMKSDTFGDIRPSPIGSSARLGVNAVSNPDPNINGLYVLNTDTHSGNWKMPITSSLVGIGGADNFLYNPNSDLTVSSDSVLFNPGKYNIDFQVALLGPTPPVPAFALAQFLETSQSIFTAPPICSASSGFLELAEYPNAPGTPYNVGCFMSGQGTLTVDTPTQYSLMVEISNVGGAAYTPTLSLTSAINISKILQ